MDALWSLTASEITTRLRAGDLTARAVTEAALGRIDVANGPLNAIVDRCDGAALAAADAVDAARAAGQELRGGRLPGCR